MDTTQIIKVDESVCSIKPEKFRLHTYAEFHNFAGTNLYLLDIVGQIVQVQGSNLEDSVSKQKIVLRLSIEDNTTIRVTLWDDHATDFRRQFHHSGQKCSVIVCTCLNPKIFAGKLHLNSSGSTKIYINYDLEVVKEFMKRMGIEDNVTPGTIAEDNNTNKNMEIWTIGQILEYISSGDNKEKEVICRRKVTDISTRNGWKYFSCASCSKKLGRSTTSLICNTCKKSTTIGVAKTMDFQVKISEYNFQASFQTFTISSIINENSLDDQNVDIIPTKPETPTNVTHVRNKEEIKTKDGEKVPTFGTTSYDTEFRTEENINTKHGEKLHPSEEDTGKTTKKQRVI